MELTIPEKLSEIKLKDYQKFMSIAENNDDAEFLNLKMIEIFCNVSFQEARAIPLKDVDEVVKILGDTLSAKRRFKRKFKIQDTTFAFIPDLENISMGEYIDITNYLGKIEDMHKLMAVLYRPVKSERNELYTIEEYEGSSKYSDYMKHAPLDESLEAQLFFYRLAKELVDNMNISSKVKEKGMSLEAMDGLTQYINSVEGIFSTSITSLN